MLSVELQKAIQAVEDADNRFQWATGSAVDAAILELGAAEQRLRATIQRLKLAAEGECRELCNLWYGNTWGVSAVRRV